MQQDTESTFADASQRELVLDGVRYADLQQAGRWWRLGATNPVWRQELLALPPEPDAAALTALEDRGLWLAPATSTPAPLAVMCCGLGSVWPGMGRELYDNFSVARAAMDRIAAVADWDVLGLMDETDVDKISRTRWQLPYYFMIEFAQWSVFTELGLSPSLLCGHSLGEPIALCFSGICSPEVAWYILDTRAMHMAELEERAINGTGMMAVHAGADVINEACATWPALYVSNYNTPNQFILSGPRDVLAEARKSLRKRRIPAIVLNVSLAFHHPSMRILRDLSLRRLNALEMHPPRQPMLSCITTGFYPADQPSICNLVADLDENSVRWTECVRAMWDRDGIRNFLELGPQDTLCSLVTDNEPNACCFSAGRKGREVEGMRQACARLYSLGYLKRDALARGVRLASASEGKDAQAGTPAPHCGLLPVASAALAAPGEVSEVGHSRAVADNFEASGGGGAFGDEVSDKERPSIETALSVVMEVLSKASGKPLTEMHPEMDLRYDLALRSSRFPLIVQEVEQALHISVNFEDLLRISTIRDLARVLSGNGGARADGDGSPAPVGTTNFRGLARGCVPPLRRYALRSAVAGADRQAAQSLISLPLDPCGTGLALRKGDVLALCAFDSSVLSGLMSGLAPLGCVLGLPSFMAEQCASLAKAGSSLVPLEMSQEALCVNDAVRAAEMARSAIAALVASHGRVDGVIFVPPVTADCENASEAASVVERRRNSFAPVLRAAVHEALPRGLRFVGMCSVVPPSSECFFDDPLEVELDALAREKELSVRVIRMLHGRERSSLNEWGDMLARELLHGTHAHVIWARPGVIAAGIQVPEPSPRQILRECPQNFPLVFPDPQPAYRATATLHQAGCHFSRFADPVLGQHGELENDPPERAVPWLPVCRSLEALLEGGRQWLPWLTVSGFCDLRFHEPLLLPPGVTRECRLTVEAEPWLMQDSAMTRMCHGILSARGLTPNGRHTAVYEPVAEGMVWLAARSGSVPPLWSKMPQGEKPEQGGDYVESFYRTMGMGPAWRLLTDFAALPDDMFIAAMEFPDASIAPGGVSGYTDNLLVVEGIVQAALLAVTCGCPKGFLNSADIAAEARQWWLDTIGFIRIGAERAAGSLRLVLRRSWADGRLLRFDAQAVDSQGHVFLTIHHLEFERRNPAVL